MRTGRENLEAWRVEHGASDAAAVLFDYDASHLAHLEETTGRPVPVWWALPYVCRWHWADVARQSSEARS